MLPFSPSLLTCSLCWFSLVIIVECREPSVMKPNRFAVTACEWVKLSASTPWMCSLGKPATCPQPQANRFFHLPSPMLPRSHWAKVLICNRQGQPVWQQVFWRLQELEDLVEGRFRQLEDRVERRVQQLEDRLEERLEGLQGQITQLLEIGQIQQLGSWPVFENI
jgi:hypothetical protein